MMREPFFLETLDGEVEGLDRGRGQWEVRFPWGMERFVGTRSEAIQYARKEISLKEKGLK